MQKKYKGTTLMNVVILVIIIVILTSIAIINVTRNIEDAKKLQKEQNLVSLKSLVNEINIRKSTKDVISPSSVTLYGKRIADMTDVSSQIPDSLLEGWYLLEEKDLKLLGLEYLDESYAVNYDTNKVVVYSEYLDSSTSAVYIVHFDANGGTVSQISRKLKFGEVFKKLPVPTRTDYTFIGWYTDANGGTKITEDLKMGNEDVTFYAHWTDGAAEMDGIYYTTLQKAIDAVYANQQEKSITLLKNISETITIAKNKSVSIDLQRYTITNNGNTNIFINNGTLTLINGTMQTNALTNGAINNNSGASINILGSKIIVTGGRQALYNNGGTATIGNNAYLSSSATERSAVHNLANGTMTILNGTIISTGAQALKIENGTVTIGDESSTSLKNTPIIQGETYGITSAVNFNLYDGTIRGKEAPIDKEGKAILKTGYGIAHSTESISSVSYKVAYLKNSTVMVASINGQNFDSLQKAIDSVPDDNTKITIRLLKNANENVTINNNQNIELDLQEFVISNLDSTATIQNNGTLSVQGGTISSDYPVAILNKGNLSVISGVIQSEGTASNANQNNATIFNDGGTLNMSGGRIVSNITGNYGFAIFLSNSTSSFTITGESEVISNTNDAIGVQNNVESISTIGYKDSNINKKYPVIQGAKCGVINNSNSYINYYDGVIKSLSTGIEESKVTTDYIINHGIDVVNNGLYNTIYLSNSVEKVASINGTDYDTVQSAIDTVPKDGTETMVKILKGIKERVTISSGQNVKLDFQNNTIANNGTSNVIVNDGTLTITNGTIFSNTSQGAINNNATGKLTMMDGSIIATGTRQAIYNNGGTLTIGGTANLSSTTKERGTVQNLANGTINITGGTITSTGAQALNIENGTVTIGDNTDGLLKVVPVLQGKTYGVTSSVDFNFYDGMLKGITSAINNESKAQLENGYKIEHGTEGSTYKTVYLVTE